MKDFMREYGKMAGFTAAGAFLLSLLVGLLSRNPFSAALARAFLLAIVFAGLAAAARFIIVKYLPELVNAAPPRAEGRPGQNIDITLPEEKPPAPARAGAYSRAPREPVMPPADLAGPDELSDGPVDGSGPRVSPETEPADLDLDTPGQAVHGDVLGDELDDALPPLADMGPELGGVSTEEPEPGADSVEEAESVPEEGGRGSAGETESSPEADSELGRLPEISSFGSPPSGARAAPPRRSVRGGESSRPEDEMKGALGSQDPATLARAIRTVLKRDEKG